jgi:hypothetical protein
MENELWVTSHEYLLKGSPFTMEVGWMARSLMQDGCFLPEAAQSPQYRPTPQSRADEHELPTWQ